MPHQSAEGYSESNKMIERHQARQCNKLGLALRQHELTGTENRTYRHECLTRAPLAPGDGTPCPLPNLWPVWPRKSAEDPPKVPKIPRLNKIYRIYRYRGDLYHRRTTLREVSESGLVLPGSLSE